MLRRPVPHVGAGRRASYGRPNRVVARSRFILFPYVSACMTASSVPARYNKRMQKAATAALTDWSATTYVG